MIRRIAYGLAGIVAWVFFASWIMCLGRGQDFSFPYDQWLVAAWWWRSMLWKPVGVQQYLTHPLPWFVIAALFPTAVAAAGVWRSYMRPQPTKHLYGGGKWSGDADLATGKIRKQRF